MPFTQASVQNVLEVRERLCAARACVQCCALSAAIAESKFWRAAGVAQRPGTKATRHEGLDSSTKAWHKGLAQRPRGTKAFKQHKGLKARGPMRARHVGRWKGTKAYLARTYRWREAQPEAVGETQRSERARSSDRWRKHSRRLLRRPKAFGSTAARPLESTEAPGMEAC